MAHQSLRAYCPNIYIILTKGERSEVVKPKNNLKMEGQLDVSRKELATSGERVEASKPKDNLKLEGKLQGDIS